MQFILTVLFHLVGYVEDLVINAVLEHPDLDLAIKVAVTRAFNKILWIQNDRKPMPHFVDI